MIEISLAAIAAVVLSVFWIRPEDIPPVETVSAAAHLEERKAVIYEGLRDLQFDFRTGKLSEPDYQSAKLSLQRELALVLVGIRDAAQAAGAACTSCGAAFPRAMKYCGRCGKFIR